MIAFDTRIERLESTAGRLARALRRPRAGASLTVDAVVNSAGLGAQALARRIDDYPADRVPRLVLAKGNYFGYAGRPVFSPADLSDARVDGGLGVHVTVDLAGRMRFGPDVEWIERENYDVDAGRAASFYAPSARYWPGLRDGSAAAGLLPASARSSPGRASPPPIS